MDWQEIKNMGVEELAEQLEKQRALFHALKQKAKTKQLKQINDFKKVKIAIARILTALNARQRETAAK